MKIVAFQAVPTPRERQALAAFAAGCGAVVREAEAGYVPCDVAVTYGMVKWDWRDDPYQLSLAAGRGVTTTVDGARALLEARGDADVRAGSSTWKAKLFRAHRGQWIIVERGFVRREEYFSAGIGGINGRAEFGSPLDGPARAAALGVVPAPWREGGGHVLVAGQVPRDVSVQDTDHAAWCRAAVATVRQMGIEVRFRPHPLMHAAYGVEALYDERGLDAALADTAAVVTWSSNLGVDAALAGVPVIALDRGSMAWDVAAHSLSALPSPRRPDRTAWLERLASSQWTPEEMRAGLAWRQLSPALEAMD